MSSQRWDPVQTPHAGAVLHLARRCLMSIAPEATFTWVDSARPVLVGPVDTPTPTHPSARFNGLPARVSSQPTAPGLSNYRS